MILLHHVRCVRHRCTHAEQWITGAKVTFAELQKPSFRQGELLLTQDDGRVQGGLL